MPPRADLSTNAMESALCPLADHLSCEVCKQSLVDRVRQLIVQWSVVKVRVASCLTFHASCPAHALSREQRSI